MCNIQLIIEPRKVKSFTEFVQEAPPNSIALDGYVKGPFDLDYLGPYANFNHHEGVDRLSTFATCGQVLLRLRAGLLTIFKGDCQNPVNIFVNDADHDVCLATWLLKNYERIGGEGDNVIIRPLISDIIDYVNKMDIFAGSYPFIPESKIVRQMTWVFDPYMESRKTGLIVKADKEQMLDIILKVHERIDAFCAGNAQEQAPDMRYKVLAEGKHVTMVEEIGMDARMKMAVDGITTFISHRGPSFIQGGTTYSLGRIGMSPVNFEKLYPRLNELEPDLFKGWGGGDNTGASARVAGSSLNPKGLIEAVDLYFEEQLQKLEIRRHSKHFPLAPVASLPLPAGRPLERPQRHSP
jgi:hypothetical protein